MKIVKLCFLSAAVAAMTVASVAQAATITWGTPAQISGPSDVSTNGTLFQALNFVGVTAETVNGVVFDSAIVTGGLNPTIPQTWGNVHLSSKPGTHVQFVDQLGTATTGDTDYDNLLQPAMFEGQPAHGGDVLTVNNLAAGVTYEIQFWSNDSRGIPVIAGRETTAEDLTSGTVLTIAQNAGAINTLGSHWIGTVVGDGTPLEIHMDTPVANASSWLLNAMQIREVPEPTSLALGLVSMMGLLVTRRR